MTIFTVPYDLTVFKLDMEKAHSFAKIEISMIKLSWKEAEAIKRISSPLTITIFYPLYPPPPPVTLSSVHQQIAIGLPPALSFHPSSIG